MKPRERVASGRLRRLGRMASLGPRAALALAVDAVRSRSAGEDPLAGVALGEAVFEVLGDLKAGSMKLGQIMAQLAEELPAAARLRLAHLYSQAPTLAYDGIAAVLEAELGGPPEARFATFEREPFAAASIGQVHRATLADGTPVAVKVQYPGVDEALRHDLDLAGALATSVGAGGLVFDTGAYFRALRDLTLSELDYVGEADRVDRMREAVAPWPDLLVPRVHRDRSSGKVLTCDLLVGPTLHERCERPIEGPERIRLGRQFTRAVLGPVFTSFLVNSDTHPGNYVVLADGRLGLLDAGAVSRLDPGQVRALADLVRLLGRPGGQDDDLVQALRGAGFGVDPASPRARRFALHLADLFAPPFRGTYDFAGDSLLIRLGKLKQERPRDVLALEPDPRIVPVMRSLIGLNHALRRLGVKDDLREVLGEILSKMPA